MPPGQESRNHVRKNRVKRERVHPVMRHDAIVNDPAVRDACPEQAQRIHNQFPTPRSLPSQSLLTGMEALRCLHLARSPASPPEDQASYRLQYGISKRK